MDPECSRSVLFGAPGILQILSGPQPSLPALRQQRAPGCQTQPLPPGKVPFVPENKRNLLFYLHSFVIAWEMPSGVGSREIDKDVSEMVGQVLCRDLKLPTFFMGLRQEISKAKTCSCTLARP